MDNKNESVTQEPNVENSKSKSFLRESIETILYLAAILAAVFLIQRFIIQPVEVDGISMEDTLKDGDHLLLEKVSYWFSGPQRFDVVVFQPRDTEKGTYYIKRVIGLPGETVQIIDNVIYIDGEPISESFGKENVIKDIGMAKEPITLLKDEYFVLGDNRNHSKDSRNEAVGVVNRESILGKAWCRIWPLNQFGFIKHE